MNVALQPLVRRAPVWSQRRAVLDLGSNSFHLLVADGEQVLADEKETVRLGERALATGWIDPEAWWRGLVAVDALVARARALSAPLAIIGTNVLRSARNGRAFALEVMRRTGHEVEILSGDDEAKLAWAGARTAVPEAARVAVLDIGGGSIDVAVGDEHGFLLTRSLPLGFLRFPVADAVRAGAGATIEAVRRLEPDAIVLTGGTARVLGRLTGARVLARDAADALATRLAELDPVARLAIGVPAARVDTIPLGATIVATLLELLGTGAHIARGGLREGMIATLHAR